MTLCRIIYIVMHFVMLSQVRFFTLFFPAFRSRLQCTVVFIIPSVTPSYNNNVTSVHHAPPYNLHCFCMFVYFTCKKQLYEHGNISEHFSLTFLALCYTNQC